MTKLSSTIWLLGGAAALALGACATSAQDGNVPTSTVAAADSEKCQMLKDSMQKRRKMKKEGRGGKQDHFALSDTNGDGLLSAAEIDAHKRYEFAKRDANGDGYLSAADREMKRAERQAEMAERMAEMQARKAELVEACGITEDQAKRMDGRRDKMRERRGERMEAMGDRRDEMKEKAAEKMAKIDTDGDGKISEAEFLANHHPMSEVDTNGDGMISKEEAEAMHAKMKSEHKKKMGKGK